jgi:hypothetical protein
MTQGWKPSLKEALDLASLSIKTGEGDRGVTTVRWLLQRDPDNIQALLWMSKCVDDPSAKIAFFQRVLDLDPTNPHALKGMDLYSVTSTDTNTSP